MAEGPAPDGIARRIDARGLLCPLPVLRARKALADMAPGALLEIAADDPMAAIDMPHFCAQAGHVLVRAGAGGIFVIRRA